MFIQTEATPNPATLKFLPGREVLAGEPRDFRTADAAAVSPLASALFMMILTLIGLGLGPLAVGSMSQIVFARYGEDSLRYALLVWQCVGFWAAAHFYFAGKLLCGSQPAATAPA